MPHDNTHARCSDRLSKDNAYTRKDAMAAPKISTLQQLQLPLFTTDLEEARVCDWIPVITLAHATEWGQLELDSTAQHVLPVGAAGQA